MDFVQCPNGQWKDFNLYYYYLSLLYSAIFRSRALTAHMPHVILNEWMYPFCSASFKIYVEMVYWECSLVAAWLVPHEVAAISAQVLCSRCMELSAYTAGWPRHGNNVKDSECCKLTAKQVHPSNPATFPTPGSFHHAQQQDSLYYDLVYKGPMLANTKAQRFNTIRELFHFLLKLLLICQCSGRKPWWAVSVRLAGNSTLSSPAPAGKR